MSRKYIYSMISSNREYHLLTLYVMNMRDDESAATIPQLAAEDPSRDWVEHKKYRNGSSAPLLTLFGQ